MKNGKLLDLYSDYLISAFGQTTASGLSSLAPPARAGVVPLTRLPAPFAPPCAFEEGEEGMGDCAIVVYGFTLWRTKVLPQFMKVG
jgi:hypothetical protein